MRSRAVTNTGASMDSSIQIEKDAATWLAKRDGSNWTEADQAALDGWLQASTAHRVAFIRLQAVWQQALRLRVLKHAQPQVLDSHSRKLSAPRWALAASVVLVAGLLAWTAYSLLPRTSYSTAVGGLASVPMTDGSKVMLNTNSEIRVRVTDAERRVNLDHGEAFFKVAKDPSRPFVVIAGGERVIAVGTQFSVRRDANGVRVAVTEGVVRVEPSSRSADSRPPAELTAGSVARSGGEGVLIQHRAVQEVEDSLSWRRGYLIFRDTTLAEAVAEFNRYTTDTIVIEDEEMSAMRIGGAFRSDNVGAFLRLLREGFDIQVEAHGEQLLLKRSE
jgi:transmembrane sensor